LAKHVHEVDVSLTSKLQVSFGGGPMIPAIFTTISRVCRLAALLACALAGLAASAPAQNQVMGELLLEGQTDVERDSGVWIDGTYVGYLKELKGKKKLLLLPGEHEVVVRQSGYEDSVQKVVIEPGGKRLVSVRLHLAPRATVPNVTATLKLTIKPG